MAAEETKLTPLIVLILHRVRAICDAKAAHWPDLLAKQLWQDLYMMNDQAARLNVEILAARLLTLEMAQSARAQRGPAASEFPNGS